MVLRNTGCVRGETGMSRSKETNCGRAQEGEVQTTGARRLPRGAKHFAHMETGLFFPSTRGVSAERGARRRKATR